MAPWDEPEGVNDYVYRKTNGLFSRRILRFSGTVIPITPCCCCSQWSCHCGLCYNTFGCLGLDSPWSSKLLKAAGIRSNAQRATKNVTTCKCQCFPNKCLLFGSKFCVVHSCHLGVGIRVSDGIWWDHSCGYLFYVSTGLLHKAVVKACELCSFTPQVPLCCCCPEYSFLLGYLQGVTVNFSC